ncbi:MAG: hypothetical protein M9894_13675 [Planctomycetes bacterium]|nr:hypothetical protein [Planctomycetota bacterium]
MNRGMSVLQAGLLLLATLGVARSRGHEGGFNSNERLEVFSRQRDGTDSYLGSTPLESTADIAIPASGSLWYVVASEPSADQVVRIVSDVRRHKVPGLVLDGRKFEVAALDFGGLSHLRLLHLTDSTLDDNLLECLVAALPELEDLDISHNSLTDRGLRSLVKCSRLRSLRLVGCEVDGAWLSDVRHLEVLDLTNSTSSAKAEAASLESVLLSIAGLPLQELRLSHSAFGRVQNLHVLAGLADLATLDLAGCSGASSAELQSLLPGLPGLIDLDLSFTGVDDATLEVVSSLPRLSRLNLSCGRVTDRGLEQIARADGLESLDLSGCNDVTDAGLLHLRRLRGLRRLVLPCKRYSKITPAAVRALGEALPGCSVSILD